MFYVYVYGYQQQYYSNPVTRYITARYGKLSMSNATAQGALADMFSFDLEPLTEQYFRFSWQAYAHAIKDRRAGKAATDVVNRFPYLTLIRPLFFVENYSLGDTQ
jgi:hypothetical protein